MDFRGTVNGIDVIAPPGQTPYCLAFVNRSPTDCIQVVTSQPQLQSALELASYKNCEVEITYVDSGIQYELTRVRLLDR